MKKKQIKQEIPQQVTKLMVFKDIAECSEYFYNEYGKLKVVKEKLDSKKQYKKIKKALDESFWANLKHICSIDNKVLQQEKKDLKNAECVIKDVKPVLQAPANETKLLNNTQGET